MRSSAAKKMKPAETFSVARDYANTVLLPAMPKKTGKAKPQSNQALSNQKYIEQMESHHFHYYETLGDFA